MSNFDMDDWYLRMSERREAMTCPICGEPFEDGDTLVRYQGYDTHEECIVVKVERDADG